MAATNRLAPFCRHPCLNSEAPTAKLTAQRYKKIFIFPTQPVPELAPFLRAFVPCAVGRRWLPNRSNCPAFGLFWSFAPNPNQAKKSNFRFEVSLPLLAKTALSTCDRNRFRS